MQQFFIDGFIKRAQAYGLSEGQAVDLLKISAYPLIPPPGKKIPTGPVRSLSRGRMPAYNASRGNRFAVPQPTPWRPQSLAAQPLTPAQETEVGNSPEFSPVQAHLAVREGRQNIVPQEQRDAGWQQEQNWIGDTRSLLRDKGLDTTTPPAISQPTVDQDLVERQAKLDWMRQNNIGNVADLTGEQNAISQAKQNLMASRAGQVPEGYSDVQNDLARRQALAENNLRNNINVSDARQELASINQTRQLLAAARQAPEQPQVAAAPQSPVQPTVQQAEQDLIAQQQEKELVAKLMALRQVEEEMKNSQLLAGAPQGSPAGVKL